LAAQIGDQAVSRISVIDRIAEIGECDIVIEAASEDELVKRRI
jgi:3-hydroxyacyl-CoA dehydrogenase